MCKRILPLVALAFVLPAAAGNCPATHPVGSTEVCELFGQASVPINPGDRFVKTIALPAGSTTDPNGVPVYSVQMKARPFANTRNPAELSVKLTLSDASGGGAIELGGVTVPVSRDGDGRVSLAVPGRPFAQPAYLNLHLESPRSAGAPNVMLQDLTVIQSFDSDVEGVTR
ncbi:MAG: hypothetical protein WBW32_14465 [Luteibacter sp.]